ncbi:hypothetical protein [Dyadobacter sediminis]|uniref:Uncharacterized protein n=1 Tax=Dyadobacter sediminis TaxID=1493691 RepID=A0A5R9KB29_9BACT|nr:hypothetical protein [Dyadobacter sediminis]TLU91927.1 hypothetical protein FEM55_14255 [Dyadobacter sediminis]GGB99048.1 hypothetical protein GCM10011325_27830 [Dyadobacter sediminis]
MAQENGYKAGFTSKLQKAYSEIQKLRLQPARELLNAERKTQPDNAFVPYLDNYADLHYLLISEDKNAYKQLSRLEEERLDKMAKLPDNSPYKRFLQAEIRMHWAFAKLKFGNEISGSWEIIKAYKLLEENQKKFPKFLPTLKSLGLLHVLIGSIPENYTWITRMLGLKGSIQTGIQELRKVAEEEPVFRQEAELIDLLLHAYTLHLSPAQLARMRQLPEEQPDNLLYHFFATTIFLKENKGEEAAGFLAKAPSGSAYIPFPFLDYLRGEIKLQRGDYENAQESYLLFQRKYSGFNYIKDSNLKLFMCFWLDNKDQEATRFINKINAGGSTIVEADQSAQRFAEDFLAGKISPSNKILYKARYATDGGYLLQAMKIMDAVSENSFRSWPEKTEFNYRKARIFQKSGKINQSIPYYERTLTLSRKAAPGFGASAALQLGYICMDKKDKVKAAGYFKTAMSFKKHEYKNSIDNKARAALTLLGE